jgi:DNA polymerase elongation subunit (family B)
MEYKVNICGIADLDYIDLYKKNRFITRESYKLDFIASVELDRKKVDYSEVASDLRTLHKKDWELYATYNVVDVALIVQLEEKLGFLGITFAVAYAAGINYGDVSSPVATWENIFFRDLINKKIILPNKKNHDKVSYEGAFVKAPQVGKHRWVCSFDLNSLYPHIIMGWNMSPETITSKVVPQVNVDMMVNGEHYDRPDGDLAVAPSGNTFLRSVQGIAGAQMERLYKERKSIKREMLAHEQDGEDIQSGDVDVIKDMHAKYGMDGASFDALATEIAKQVSLKDGGQQVRKILLNSFYGALANIYFCMFDIRIAESITLAGQLAIRWVGRKTNEYLNGILKTKDVDYVVYTDTDSIYVNMEPVCAILGEKLGFDHNAREGEDVQKAVRALDKFCEDKMQKMIDDGYQDLAQYCNSYQQKMVMAREVISDNSVFCSKKMYAMSVWNSEGVQFEDAYIKVMGIGMVVKSSTPQFVRDASKKTVKMILNSTEADVQDFIKDFKKSFRNEKPEAIAFPRGVNKLEETYCDVAGNIIQGKTVPIHSRAAIVYNKAVKDYGLDGNYETIGVADKMKFIHLELPNKLNQNVIGFVDTLPPELDLHKKVDYDLMFEKTYLKPVRDMMDLIGWSVEPVASLEDFFC